MILYSNLQMLYLNLIKNVLNKTHNNSFKITGVKLQQYNHKCYTLDGPKLQRYIVKKNKLYGRLLFFDVA
jgi:hypothetical protein